MKNEQIADSQPEGVLRIVLREFRERPTTPGYGYQLPLSPASPFLASLSFFPRWARRLSSSNQFCTRIISVIGADSLGSTLFKRNFRPSGGRSYVRMGEPI